ncbi:MAG: hypothetical protein RL660_2663 [Bacteroidota bacterium]|jgi:hypothetical protein
MNKLKLIKVLNTLALLVAFSPSLLATVWSPALPYEQKNQGQDVVVKATAYDPHWGLVLVGVTKVYLKHKLLYTMDMYFRKNVYTSDDGEYLCLVYTYNMPGVESYDSLGCKGINLSRAAIDIFKHGKFYKRFAIRDLIDTTKLERNGYYYNWGYRVKAKFDEEAKEVCDACKELIEKQKHRPETMSKADVRHWHECQQECAKANQRSNEIALSRKSIYVQHNALFIHTNQETFIKLDFKDLTVTKIAATDILGDTASFNPPQLTRKYKKVKMPDRHATPNLRGGCSLEQATASYFNLAVADENRVFCIFIDHLVIDKMGRCVKCVGAVYDERISTCFDKEAINKEMTDKFIAWIQQQRFQTRLMPRGFKKYSFRCIVNLE